MLNSVHYFILVRGCCQNLTASNKTATQGAKVSLKGLVHRNKLYTAANQKVTHSPHHAVEKIFVLRCWLVKGLHDLSGHCLRNPREKSLWA